MTSTAQMIDKDLRTVDIAIHRTKMRGEVTTCCITRKVDCEELRLFMNTTTWKPPKGVRTSIHKMGRKANMCSVWASWSKEL
jgi:hypothetical protein